MQKCPECNQLNKDQSFCSKCGTKLPELVTTSKGKTPMSKKTKIMAATGVGVVVLATAFVFTGKAMADKEKVLDSFVEALNEGNVSKVKKNLASSNKDLKVTDQHAESLIAYMKQDEGAFVGLEGKWEADAGMLSKWDLENEYYYYSYYEDFPVTYEKVGKTWLFFDNYAFVLEASPVIVRSESPDLTLTVDGEAVDSTYKDSEYNLGEYLPGLYKLVGKVENDFGTNEKEVELNVYDSTTHYMDFDLNTATFITDNYIAGTKLIFEDIDKELDVTSGYFEFGPLLTDGTISYHIESETPFGKLSSPALTIDESTFSAALAPDDELKQELTSAISGALLSKRTAYQEQDTNKLDFLSGESLEEAKDQIEYSIDYEHYYAGYLNQIGIDWNNTRLSPVGTIWKAILPTKIVWEQSWYYKGDTPNIEPLEEEVEFELIYSEEGWKVTSKTDASYVESTETYNFTRDEQNESSSTEASITEGQKNKLSENAASALIENFGFYYANAVNWGDADYLDDVGTTEFKKYMEKDILDFYKKDISESFVEAEVTSRSENEDGSYTIQTIEVYEIYHPENGNSEKTFTGTYKAIYDEKNETWLLNELVKIDTVSSVDL
ncbi:TcaA second domain-containing protein [Alkalihalobacillus sp. NPDC078783]